ncbi:MAG TPA: hypothetical protein VN238_16795 [Solirubrobacteraceae bacterium]|nr:hypothetical protein [Solirubrobacteraceae bacterium]
MRVRVRVLVALLALALLVACVPAGASGGAGARSASGPRDTAPQPPFTQPVGGTITVPDPEDGRAWRLRVRRTSSGPICSTVQRPGARRRWRLSCHEELRAEQQHTVAVSGLPDRTAVHGLVGPGVVRVELVGLHAQPVRLARRARAFFAVLAGQVPIEELALRFTFRDGRTRLVDWSSGDSARPLDPVSGERWGLWTSTGRGQPAVLSCATFATHEATGQGPPGQLTNMVCGDLRTVPFAVQIGGFAGHLRDRPNEVRTIRTLALGVVGPRVATVDLLVGAAPPRRLELTADGRGFLVVLPPDVLPSTVRLVMTFTDGTTQTIDRSTGLSPTPLF